MEKRAHWLGLCLLMLGCQDLDVEKTPGEPCTRTSQCEDGLVCLAGICIDEDDAALDAAFEDAALETQPSEGF